MTGREFVTLPRRGGGVAGCGAGTAVSDTGDRDSQPGNRGGSCGRGVISFALPVVREGLMRGITLITPIALVAA